MFHWLKWCLLFGSILLWAMPAHAVPVATSSPMVAQISLQGPIGPASAEYFEDASQRAVDDGAAAIVLRLDTPGGLSVSMRQIITRMLACPLPVLVYVTPQGARAASAGTYILYAGQIAAMAPATHLGAATPVALGRSTPMPLTKSESSPASASSSEKNPPVAGDAESNKETNDAVAYIRSLAQLRERNGVWAEQAVRGAETLTAQEAAQQKVIDFVATDVQDLLRQAEGRQVKVGDRSVKLQLAGASVTDYAPTARSQFLQVITHPTIAYLLLMAGLAGLLLEALHPGAMLPGIVGGISLLIGLYALQLLPVNYAGLALLVLGVGLLVAEAVQPSIGALGAGGMVSFIAGSTMLMDTNVPGYAVNLGVIAGIAFSAAVVLGIVLWLALRAHRARQVTGDATIVSDAGKLLEPTDATGHGWMMLHGERWRVRCETALAAGATVRVMRRDGLLLWVEPA
jgi:membrane-bound serine protease (ClpP class)